MTGGNHFCRSLLLSSLREALPSWGYLARFLRTPRADSIAQRAMAYFCRADFELSRVVLKVVRASMKSIIFWKIARQRPWVGWVGKAD